MNRYPVQARLASPLAIRRDRQSERSEGVNSASGTVVRGALAQAYLQQTGQADENFRRLFLDEFSCRFGPLDPTPATLPLTALSCKRRPGFLGQEKETHGMLDALWLRIAARLSRWPLMIPLPSCQVCGQDLKPQTGFHQGGLSKQSQPIRHVVAAHVGIDRSTTTAADSIFFSLEALEPRSDPGPDPDVPDLVGWIDATNEAYSILKSVLEREDHLVMMGHARTRGYGRVRLTLGEPTTVASNSEAWRRWSDDLLTVLGDPEWAVPLDGRSGPFVFALTLPTGAILVDDLLRSSLDPADALAWLPRLPVVDDLRPLLEREPVEIEGGRIWSLGGIVRQERVRGWNAAHGLPRQDEWAIARGSTFAYWFEGDPDACLALQDRLESLEKAGVGLRRNEGFGQVIISDDFHRQYHQQEGS